MPYLPATLFVALQHVLPKYLLTSLVYRLARVRNETVKNALISRFVSAYNVDVSEIDKRVPDDFPTFNDFFTRELANGARPVDADDAIAVSPVDGTVSAAGTIDRQQLFQAKGRHYALHDLLATNLQEADEFIGGSFATIYLAPYNYHRVHCPLTGELRSLRYVPGELFSVNNATASQVPRLFCRNERLICQFETDVGPMAVIFVGALNVGSITTPWTGELRPQKRGVGAELSLSGQPGRQVQKGELLGWFNMGSTVIVLLPPGAISWNANIDAGHVCRMGEPIGTLK